MTPALRALYRLLLYAWPAGIRRAHGAEMIAGFEQGRALVATRCGTVGRIGACLRGLADVFWFGLRARAERDSARPLAVRDPRRPIVFLRDIRGAVRALRVQPAMSAAIVVMFALGIGATTGIFSFVYGVLLRPLPFPEPDRLVQVWGTRIDRGWSTVALTAANFWDVRDMNQTFEAIGALRGTSFSLTGAGLPERVSAAQVSAGFFQSLAVPAAAGRVFAPGDDDPGPSETRVVLSHGFWARRFGSDASILGRSLTLDGRSYSVIGVLPPGSPWLDNADLFVPLVHRLDADRDSFEYAAIGRLKPGVTPEAAQADLDRIAMRLAATYPKTNTNLGMTLQPSRTWVASDELRRTLWILLGAVGLLLVIACVNVTNLLLARASARAREGAVRTALGATRADLVRERLAESIFYSAAGGALGLVIAYSMVRLLTSLDMPGIPRLAEVAVNGWVVLFATATALVVGAVAGVLPALWMPIGDIATTLRPSQRGTGSERGQDRLRSLLIVGEVALSLVLLVGAGLLVRSLVNVLSVDRGFQVENRMLVTVSIPGSYDAARITRVTRDVIAKVGALPEVAGAATVSGRPLSGGSTGMGIAAADAPDTSDTQVPWATWRFVSEDYFTVMGLPVIAGRSLTDQDVIGKPWRVMISKRTADLLWPGQNAVGRTAILWKGQNENRGEVVGVVGDMRERGLENDPTLAVYFPSGGITRTSVQLIIHTKGRSQDATAAIRTVIAAVDPDLPISDIRTMEEVVSASVAGRRMTMMMLVTFAAVALLLALAGVYSVLSYSVARRTSEIGVRLALGADHNGVLRLIMRQGLRPVAIGAGVGLAATFWLTRLMSSLLFELEPNDPATYAGVAALVFLVAGIACYIPARRVLRVDPAIALRAE